MNKTIFTALSPNTESDDIWLALKLIFQPWRWTTGESANIFCNKFKSWLPAKSVYLFTSGRGCLKTVLSALELEPDDEVLLQAYTCVAVANPIIWVGAKPIYVDIEADSLNMSPADLEKKITPKSKVLIIQHTFGQPAKINELIALAKKHNLFVIEDCAHALGSTYHGQKVGTFGAASFFSFGRDKVISSVYGGALTTNNPELANKIDNLYQKIDYPNIFWIIQQLLHPLIMSMGKATYNCLNLGKIIINLSKKIKLTSLAVQPIEHSGGEPQFLTKKLPEALACLALQQFNKLDKLNTQRQKIADYYNQKLKKISAPQSIYLRYLLTIPNPKQLITQAKADHILLDSWYAQPIAPSGVDYHKIYYQIGSCPVAEKVAAQSCNLPTNISIDLARADKIIDIIKKYYASGN